MDKEGISRKPMGKENKPKSHACLTRILGVL